MLYIRFFLLGCWGPSIRLCFSKNRLWRYNTRDKESKSLISLDPFSVPTKLIDPEFSTGTNSMWSSLYSIRWSHVFSTKLNLMYTLWYSVLTSLSRFLKVLMFHWVFGFCVLAVRYLSCRPDMSRHQWWDDTSENQGWVSSLISWLNNLFKDVKTLSNFLLWRAWTCEMNGFCEKN